MFAEAMKAAMSGYDIRPVQPDMLPEVLRLFLNNRHYFSITQAHAPTLKECAKDITALPHGAGAEQKSYLAFYREGRCTAVLDFIERHPEPGAGFIGLLVVDSGAQGRGMGRSLMEYTAAVSKEIGLTSLQLTCQSERVFLLDESGVSGPVPLGAGD